MSNKKKTKILLLSVLTEKNAIITEELGICSIASFLEQDGFQVALVNSTRSYLDMEKIYETKADIIGVPMYSTTEKVVVEVCTKIKKNNPNITIVMGGYWPTLYGKQLMETYDIFDFAIMGEGEIPFRDLSNAIENKTDTSNIKSLIYRNSDCVVQNERGSVVENLDTLPFPRRDLLENSKLKYAYISTSRGCMANCNFCWNRKFWNPADKSYWRGRSPENIIKEIKHLIDAYGVNRYWFIDSSFEDSKNGTPDRMWAIAQKIIDEKLNITYETYFRSEVYKKFSPEKMELMKKSGLVGVIFGTEAGNADDLRLYGKIATVEDNLNSIKYFRENNIAIDIGFINFNPYSTFENLRKNADFLEETVYASVLYYFVERCQITEFSALYYKVKNDGLLLPTDKMGCYEYKFINEDIGRLSEYLYNKYHGNEDSIAYFYAKKIGSIIREEFKILSYLKRNFGIHNDKIMKAIEKNEETAWNLLREINSINADCFRQLLDMTESKWNENEAEKITEESWSLQNIKEMSDKLEKNRLSLYMNLNKLGLSPTNYFNINI